MCARKQKKIVRLIAFRSVLCTRTGVAFDSYLLRIIRVYTLSDMKKEKKNSDFKLNCCRNNLICNHAIRERISYIGIDLT